MKTTLALIATALAFPIALAAQDRPAPAIDVTELVRRTSHTLDSLAGIDQFSGVVLVMRGADTVFRRAVGMADRERKLRNEMGTSFNLGSINKAFTQIAIRQMAEAGKLSLDSTLGTYWPEYPNADARKVTIRQLLTHRSGIGGNIFAAPAGKQRHDVLHNADYVQLFVNDPLLFAPGARQQYSNAGYVLLGALVQRLSGEDYYEYVKRHVYEPAGMTMTRHLYADTLPSNTARGYTRQGQDASSTPRLNTALLPGRGSAAGGGYSTATDLLKFVRALRERRIAGGGPGGIGIAGGAPGLNGIIEADIIGGYDVIVLSNLDPPAAERVGRMIRSWLGERD